MQKKIVLLFCLIVGGTNFIANGMIETPYPLLTRLLRDMGKYKIYREHEGELDTKGRMIMHPHHFHLLEHSMLVDLFLANGVRYPGINDINLCNGLTKRILFVLSAAALLHDVGKAGKFDYAGDAMGKDGRKYREIYVRVSDDVIYFQGKQPHEDIGAQYILHELRHPSVYPAYHIVDDDSEFKFSNLFDQLGLSDVERKIVTFLVWSHKLFPMVYNASLPPEKRDVPTITPDAFFSELNAMMYEVNLTISDLVSIGISYKVLLQMIIALTLADVLSLYFELPEGAGISSPVLGRFIPVYARRKFYHNDTFDEYTIMIGHVQRIFERANEWIPRLLSMVK